LALRPEIPVKRVWRPFQLNPELPRNGLPRELYLQIKFGLGRNAARVHANIAAAGHEEGIAFAFDRIQCTPNTVNAHRLIALAAREGAEDALVAALYHAYFVEALDIGDVDVLTDIAAGCGLGRTATRHYLAGDSGTMEVLAEEYRARRIGIHAVPCFIVDNGYAVSGAQEPEMFLPLFDLAAVMAERERVIV
jgi:predicted DsbA family dithiol-disulfide isomerase